MNYVNNTLQTIKYVTLIFRITVKYYDLILQVYDFCLKKRFKCPRFRKKRTF